PAAGGRGPRPPVCRAGGQRAGLGIAGAGSSLGDRPDHGPPSMSRTLFWYVFRDLLKIFLLASAGLAGIMSFGGLLRPVTEHGLDSTQVVQILTYFLPAMTTYSLPIAALFATTMVYGRLSNDNEITA